MTQECPKTCNRCPVSPGATQSPQTISHAPINDNFIEDMKFNPCLACVDRLNPKTGASDCPTRVHLCNSSLYYSLMSQECPQTCKRCPETTNVTQPSGCRDLVSPITGVSNCAEVASYCKDPQYITLMKQQCSKTCGFCN
ncbi:shTK domain protein [Dictyocaulus viviparus]|uniref:ShTK domain protein n=1 Tax=Dictyocaulus viviparus TaxID=29172 RepID=A0A0D8XDW4_DICVI|nr:shTK domain protein [Dictyocaulus viviparus]